MVLLHIGSFGHNIYSGIFIVAPQHIIMQQSTEQVAFVNISNVSIKGVNYQYKYDSNFQISNLPSPFSKPDLVIFHGIYIKEYLRIYKQLKKHFIPYIIIPHGSLTIEALNKKRIKKKTANILFFNKFINNAIAIQYLSKHECESSNFGKEKFICTNGISIPNLQKTSFHEDKVILTYIGRLDYYHKGLDLLIQAVKKKESFLLQNKCKINLYGPNINNQAETIKKLIAENSVSNIVELHDAIIGKEKESVLLNTDIFIQTSRFEGMPMGILEALSYGIPCLVTDGTTLGSLIKQFDAGWCSETSVDAIADKLEIAVKNANEYKQKSLNAVKLISHEFVWEKVCSKELIAYRQYVSTQEQV